MTRVCAFGALAAAHEGRRRPASTASPGAKREVLRIVDTGRYVDGASQPGGAHGAADLEHRPAPPGPRVRTRRLGRRLLRAAVLAVVVGTVAVAALTARAILTLPPLNRPAGIPGASSLIFDRNGNLVTAVPGGSNRQPVQLAQVPKTLQHAFVAVEDKRFYQTANDGLDLRGLARAAWVDLRGGSLQGGSTIVEQLAKNLYLSSTDTITRKIQEFWIGLQLSRTYTKAEILQQYMNVIYLGNGAWGVQAASLAYFGKPVGQLDLAQSALVAGLAQAPSAYDPRVHPAAARARRNLVLALMAQQGYVSQARAQAAEAAPLGLSARPATASAGSYPDPWFVDAVVAQLEQQYHMSPQQVVAGGLRIQTTLDPKVQAAADKAVASLNRAGGRLALSANPQLQAAEVVLDPTTGGVLAIVGGRQHTTPMGFDRALQAVRQPGSSIKPLVDYTPALLQGLTPGTVVDDTIHTYPSGSGTYAPRNDNGVYYGLTTLTEALRRSVNTVAVQVLNHIGVAFGIQTAQRMGLPLTSKDQNLAVAIGGTADCCTPLNMADAYATLANGGYHVTPHLITAVIAPDGQTLLRNPIQRQRAIPAADAYVMTKMLETVDQPQPNQGWDVLSGKLDSNWGTGYDATVQDNVPGWPTAGKTGTTSSNEDAWYVGYTPKLVAAVWLGYDQPRPFPGLYGGVYAGPIFRQTLTAALAGQTPVHFQRPPGVVTAPIDIKAAPWTVALPSPLTPKADTRQEWFVAGTQPTAVSNLWVSVRVDPNAPSLAWDPTCGDLPVTHVFLNRPPYPRALARRMALAANVSGGASAWRSVVPVDASLRPPTQSCATYQAGTGTGTGG